MPDPQCHPLCHPLRHPARGRRRWPALLTAALLLPVALVAPAAPASAAPTCTTTWTAPVSGAWTDAPRWSAGVPTSSSVACITANGTYTVTLSGSASVAGLVVGGASGLATLAVTASCAANVPLSLGGPSETNARGRIDLTSAGCGNYALLDGPGPLTAAGSLRVLAGSGGARYLRVPTTLTGSLDVGAASTLSLDAGELTVSGGALSVAATGTLAASGTGRITAASGTVANAGTVSVSTTWTQGGATVTGTPPLVTGTLAYTGAGASTIVHRGGALTGNVSAGQTLRIQADCAVNAAVTTGPMTNAGRIELTSTGCGNYALLGSTATGDTVTTIGAGTIALLPGAGGIRYLRAPIRMNAGTLSVSTASGAVDAGGITLAGGRLDVLAGAALAVTGSGAIMAASGTVANAGTVSVSTTWTQGGATVTGTPPLVTGTLAYTGAGASTIVHRGGALTGNVSAGQTLRIQADCAVNAFVTTGPMTNAGRIELTSTGCGNYALLGSTATGDTVTSIGAGTIALLPGAGGVRYLRAPIRMNAGTLSVSTVSGAVDAGGITLAGGTLDVLAGAALAVTGSGAITATSGTVANAGTVSVSTTWTQGGATVTGTPPSVTGTLAYTGAGAGAIVHRGGALTGNVSAGQTLRIQADCAVNAAVTTGPMTNAGRIELTSTGCGNYALLGPAAAGNTVTNLGAGTIAVLAGAGGARYLRANVTNQGTLSVEAGATLTMDGPGKLTQTASGTTRVGVASATSYGRINASVAPTLAGSLAADRLATYTPAPGQTWPVVTFPSKTGVFATVTGSYPGRHFAANQTATQVQLLTRADPTITTIVPASVARGAVNVSITVNGTGFGPGTTLAASGTGVTFGPITVVSATKITTKVTVTAGAAVGARSVTVTRGAGTTTKVAALTVT